MDNKLKIYNLFLEALAEANDRPCKSLLKYEKLDDSKKGALEKLEKFFQKHPHLMSRTYFIAPYKIYKDKKFFSLNYFSTVKCMLVCSSYVNLLVSENTDHPDNIRYTTECVKFVLDFCKEKKIKLTDYLNYATVHQPDYLLHLKNKSTNLYTVFYLEGFAKLLNLPPEEYELYLGDTKDQLNFLHTKYSASKLLKKTINQVILANKL